MFVRYDQPDEHGETRRERYARFSEDAPIFEIPDEGQYLWDWYHDCSNGLKRIDDGVCIPIPPSEYKCWAEISGNEVRLDEYAVLRAMDTAFCDEMNIELQSYHERQREAHQREMDAAKVGRK